MKKIVIGLSVCLAAFIFSGWCNAGEGGSGLVSGIEVLTGWSYADLKSPQEEYAMVPLIVDFDFDLKPLVRKWGLNPTMLVQAQLEPFINTVYSPDANVEVGNAFALKVGFFPDTWSLQPYIKAGLGMVYMTQHTLEQSTQFNFIEFGGFGVHYFLTKNLALTVEGRFRHLSNSGIDHPNSGINNTFALAGISYQF